MIGTIYWGGVVVFFILVQVYIGYVQTHDEPWGVEFLEDANLIRYGRIEDLRFAALLFSWGWPILAAMLLMYYVLIRLPMAIGRLIALAKTNDKIR